MGISKILILGATGMLGHALFSLLSDRSDMEVSATVRSADGLSQWFSSSLLKNIQTGVDAHYGDTIQNILDKRKPDIVVNCIGIIKQLPEAHDPIIAITMNALFPHQLARRCDAIGARLIHISTDCVFSGKKGHYVENDLPDADDLYGRTKLLGEVSYPRSITLRTSIIGHELKGKYGLVEWFLGQKGRVKGYSKAIYSGFPTIEMARIIAEYVIPNKALAGLYHVSSDPISKYELLRLVAERYGKTIEIERYDQFHCDRSLDSARFRLATGYEPPAWPELIDKMYLDFERREHYNKPL